MSNGKPINPNYMPTKVYRLPEEKLPADNTIMFRIDSGLFLVNQTVYDVFCEHRLGNTPYYFLNVGKREVF